MSTAGHRPGVFKKPAKLHKSWKGKRTKGEINENNRGREGVKEITRSNAHRSMSRDARKNQAKQQRAVKMALALEKRRFSSAPTLVTVLTLGVGARPEEFVNKLSQSADDIIVTHGKKTVNFSVPRFKSRLAFLTPDHSKLDDVLDSIQVSDALCVLWPLDANLTEWDEQLITIIKANGLPALLHVAPGLSGIQNNKRKDDVKKSIEGLLGQLSLNASSKLLPVDSASEGLQLVRALIETKKKPLALQAFRPYMLAECLAVEDSTEETCTLVASGYLRGAEWNANHLVNVPGAGDFQISKIVTATDPHPLKANGHQSEARVLVQADKEKQQSLQSEMEPDPLAGEQTWPTTEELAEADKKMKRVPKGTSTYQAAWILESDEENEDEEDDDEDMDDDDSQDGDLDAMEEEAEADDDDRRTIMSETTEASEMGDVDEEVDESEVDKYREERENAKWPDEVDTPRDVPARVHFQKYRGLKSFRTSPWDPKENLPIDYAKIFQFANYNRTKKQVISKAKVPDAEDAAIIGRSDGGVYSSVYIQNFPLTQIDNLQRDGPLVLFQLLPHEQKMSVVNFVLRKRPTCLVPIANRQKLVFYAGYRRFEAEAVFSQHTKGDKFKMERFMPADKPFVATVFAPIMFPPASVLVFRVDDKGRQELVATGTVLDVNPNRIVLKRIVLSGHPYKINKRSTVVRYMFFNREDIDWFKPVELHTPSGRRGHIKEAVGTHGNMKCRFDQQLNSQDTVMLNLYKRAFPTWSYTPLKGPLNPSRLVESSSHASISAIGARTGDEMEE